MPSHPSPHRAHGAAPGRSQVQTRSHRQSLGSAAGTPVSGEGPRGPAWFTERSHLHCRRQRKDWAPRSREEVGLAGAGEAASSWKPSGTVPPPSRGADTRRGWGRSRRGPPELRAGRAWHGAAGGGTAFVFSWRPPARAVPCMWMRTRQAPRPPPPQGLAACGEGGAAWGPNGAGPGVGTSL